jgi:hypothetical protein
MGMKTYPEQAKRRRSRLSAVPIGGEDFTFSPELVIQGLGGGLPTG